MGAPAGHRLRGLIEELAVGLFHCRRCAAQTVHEVQTPEDMRAWAREDTVLFCAECRSPAGFTEDVAVEASGRVTRTRRWTLSREARMAGRAAFVERLRLIDQNIAANLPQPGDVSFRDAAAARIAAARK
ncbi:MAG TPA: hypothetical protein PKA64_01540 [Myxococcota bacterium]|nr:hypothetical protein [Myxococcota bacterium]